MLNALSRWRTYLPTQARLLASLPVVVITLLGLCFGLLTALAIIPAVQARSERLAQLPVANRLLQEAQAAQAAVPIQVQAQIDGATARLQTAADAFLSETQAADALNALYQYARESGVTIVELQNQTNLPSADTDPAAPTVYTMRTLGLRATGEMTQLINFVARIRESRRSGFVITNLRIGVAGTTVAATANTSQRATATSKNTTASANNTGGLNRAPLHAATMNVNLYTSEYARGITTGVTTTLTTTLTTTGTMPGLSITQSVAAGPVATDLLFPLPTFTPPPTATVSVGGVSSATPVGAAAALIPLPTPALPLPQPTATSPTSLPTTIPLPTVTPLLPTATATPILLPLPTATGVVVPSATATTGATAAPTTAPTTGSTTGPTTGPTTVPTLVPTATGAATATGVSSPTALPTLPAGCSNLLVNSDFEGEGGWTPGENALLAQVTANQVYSGARAMQLGNPPGAYAAQITSYSSIQQDITIPAAATKVVLRWWQLDGSEEAVNGEPSDAQDRQDVILLGPGGDVLRVLDRVRNNDGGWQQMAMDLSTFRGQSMILYFNVYNDGNGGRTWRYLDEVRLEVCLAVATALPPTATSVPTLTPSVTPLPTETPTPTVTPTWTVTPLPTETPSPTVTPTWTATPPPTETPTPTFTPTWTTTPPTETPTSTPLILIPLPTPAL